MLDCVNGLLFYSMPHASPALQPPGMQRLQLCVSRQQRFANTLQSYHMRAFNAIRETTAINMNAGYVQRMASLQACAMRSV